MLVEFGQARQNGQGHEGQAERRVRDEHGHEPERQLDADEKDEQRNPHDHLRRDGQDVQGGVQELASGEFRALEAQRGEHPEQRRQRGRQRRHGKRVHHRVDQRRIAEKLAVPLEREPFPRRRVLGGVEGIRDHHKDGQKQERIHDPEPQFAEFPHHHATSSMRSREATLRLAIRYTAMSRASSSVRMVLAAAPSGQSRATMNWFLMKLPMSILLAPPRISGI